MATEAAVGQSPSTTPETAQIVEDHSHAFQNTLNTTQTDSAPDVPETAKPAVNNNSSEVPSSDAPKPVAQETEPLEPVSSGVDNATAVTNDTGDTIGPKDEVPVIEPVTGVKRDLDASEAPDSTVPVENKETVPVSTEERDSKKQKTDEKPDSGSNGRAPSDTKNGSNEQKKEGRHTKDKIKDVMKKVIPGDSIGSRTRSRTKGA
ncbi:uncharacterized protein N7511_010800 [Penicillium nucicola]|uniref:uncharacterized protein n=1 Tax=Penicillium nucicola TaxID=1850975 RepID=UPI00254559C1|nr:uncharacterized protein N7511_010800 [Penicillium nucicola]KAJ5749104.1 hypothetical protein N7511_010800 [Penicillium nucicola]